MKKKIAIITNVPSPYRVDFFYYLQTHYEDYEFSIIYYCNDNMSRQWKADEDRILNSYYVPSKTIRIKKRFDDHFISFPVCVGRLLTKLAPEAVVAMEYNPILLHTKPVENILQRSCSGDALVPETQDTIYKLDGRDNQFGEEYRKASEAFTQIYI